ncbi:hypothetical protein SDC9_149201 [bioreactor metagenome]|uniref:Uncharacterized protein n=1 Tax=bioreactor metagenome TaxID=1076179 RepID=A0A645EIY8_9ZZZZ
MILFPNPIKHNILVHRLKWETPLSYESIELFQSWPIGFGIEVQCLLQFQEILHVIGEGTCKISTHRYTSLSTCIPSNPRQHLRILAFALIYLSTLCMPLCPRICAISVTGTPDSANQVAVERLRLWKPLPLSDLR